MTLRILLIDDTPEDRELAARELQRHLTGIEIQEAMDPATLDAALAGPPFGLVITDYRLRWTNGLVVLKRIKAAWPECPVIMFTGTGSEAVAVEGMKAGLDDYVVKSAKHYLALSTAARAALERADARRRAIDAERERDRLVVELRRALEARDRFLQVASHELKNPLNGLVLQIEALLRDAAVPEGSKLRARLERASSNVHHMVDLIERLLDFSRIHSGKVDLEPEDVELGAVVKTVLGRVESELRRNGCETTIDAPAPVRGRWDRLRLEQIVMNLVSNAAKFGAGKPIAIASRQVGSSARLEVRDNGIGIASVDQERIFHRFERAVSEKNYSGFGLGLAITRELVSVMGGTISVESEPGRGAAFVVVLPLDPARRHG